VYLATSTRQELSSSLESLFANFNNRFEYPVILFYDNNDYLDVRSIVAQSANQVPEITEKRMKLVRAIRLPKPEFPPGFDAGSELQKGVVYAHLFPNYQHMVRIN
jgi:hypothetical protein